MLPTIHIKHFSELTVAEHHRIVEAREQVFFLEQQVTCPDADRVDLQSTYLWIEAPSTEPGTPQQPPQVIAFLRIIPAGVVYREASIGRVLVAAAHRRQGLARLIMQEAFAYIASRWGAQPVRISAQAHLVDFYGSLGFEPISEVYMEAGIPHVKLLKS